MSTSSSHSTIGEGKTAWDTTLIEQMRAKNMAVVPTLKLFPYELKRMELPERVVDGATSDAVEQVRSYSKAGGQILFGTDVGYMADYDPTEEYRLMARALTPMEILASLTTSPAARWKEDKAHGRVAEGLDADLVVLDADPAADAANFAKSPLHDPRRAADLPSGRPPLNHQMGQAGGPGLQPFI